MRRFLTRFAIRLLIALCLLVGAARVVGVYREHPAAALIHPFECDPQPCWGGIHPGVTTLAEAENILQENAALNGIERRPTDSAVCWYWLPQWHHTNGYAWDGCYSRDSSGYMLFLRFEDNGVRFGDLLHLLRPPDTSFLCVDRRIGWIESPDLRLYVAVPANQRRIMPDLMVTELSYYYRDLSSQPLLREWQGLSRWAHVLTNCSGA